MDQGHAIFRSTIKLTAASTARRGVAPLGGVPAAGGRTLGPADETLLTGDVCPVVTVGSAAWESGGVFALHDKLQMDASGRVVLFAAGVFCAVALEPSTASGQFPECVVVPN